jgi:hypothetical protein
MKGTENTQANILNKKLGYKKNRKQKTFLFFEKTETTLS